MTLNRTPIHVNDAVTKVMAESKTLGLEKYHLIRVMAEC